jgi:chromosome segregation ATPase
MIYLIMKMFLYLLIALVAGGAAGWLLRNVAAMRQEDELNKSLADARGRVPQFESLLRSRDELVKQLRMDLKTQEAKSSDLQASLGAREREMREKSAALSKAVARSEALEGVGVSGDADESENLAEASFETEASPAADAEQQSAEDNQTIGALLDDIERLRDELQAANAATANAVAETAAAEAELSAHNQGDSADRNDTLVKQVAELQAQLAKKEAEQEQLSNMLQTEQRKLAQLEKERELQNKSLQVLHQQLELERERTHQARA